jgi:hypothetical protein
MKPRLLFVFLLFFIFISCKKNHEKNLDYIHLEQISKRLTDDLSRVSTEILNSAQLIQSGINFTKEINWGAQNKYMLNQNGALFLSSEKNTCAVFLPAGVELTPTVKKAIINSEPIDTILMNICNQNSIVTQAYFLDTNSFLRIYPYINVAKQYFPSIRLTDFFAYKSIVNKPFIENNAYWVNQPYADPSGRGWIISCLSPLYYREQFLGIISADIMLKKICEKHLYSESEKFILINMNGEILSCSKKAASFLSIPIKEEYPYFKPLKGDLFLKGNPSLLNNQKKEIRKAISSLINGASMVELTHGSSRIKIFSTKIKETNWLLLKIIN